MATLLDYELAYNFYTAEKQYHQEQTALSIKLEQAIINESSTEVIQEGVIESVRKFINKIVSGIQNAWNKFKDKVLKVKLKYGNDDIQKAIDTLEPNFNTLNHAVYNLDFLAKIKINDVIPEITANADDLTKEEFLKKYYSSIVTDTSKPVYDNLKKRVITSTEDKHKVTKEDLQNMFNYLKSYDELTNSCNNDINSLNTAAKSSDTAINNAVNNIRASQSATQQVNASAYFADMEYYFNEETKDDKPKVDKESTKNDNKDELTKIIEKKINIFFQATTEVFSAKLKIYQEIRNYYNEVINTHMARYMKDGLKNKISGNKDNKNQAEVGGVPQVTA